MEHKNKKRSEITNTHPKYPKILLLALLAVIVIPTFVYSHPGHGGSSIHDELDEVNKQIAKLEQEVLIHKNTAGTLASQINLIKAEVRLLELRIELLQKDVHDLEEQVLLAEFEIEELKKVIAHKKLMVREYVRLIHEDDKLPVLEVLVATDKFSDFLVRQSSLVTVEESIHNTLTELKRLEQELVDKVAALELKKQRLLEKQGELLAKRQSLESRKISKTKLLKQTRSKEGVYKQQLAASRRRQRELFKIIVEEGGKNTNYVSAGKTPIFAFPLAKGFITQGYGYTDYAKDGNYGGGIHNGIDIAAGGGDVVRAPADGTFYKKGTENCGTGCRSAYGNWLILRHTYKSDDGKSKITYYTFYAHLQSESRASGNVKKDDIIGYVGTTGFSSGYHLHFSIFRVICSIADDSCSSSMPVNSTGPGWYAKNSVDPFDFLKEPSTDVTCTNYTDWDSAYRHTDQCYKN